jgi:hypothetical protein
MSHPMSRIAFSLSAASLCVCGAAFAPVLAADLVLPAGTHVVSRSSTGEAGNAPSIGVSLSGDGRFAVFYSEATNLVAGDSNGASDVFVHDRDPDEDLVYDEPDGIATERVSVGPGAVEANSFSFDGEITPDGRFVLFSSAATNLVPSDTNDFLDLFVRDRQTGTTERVNVTSDEKQTVGESRGNWISDDGNLVVFTSSDPQLFGTEDAQPFQVFLRNRAAGTTTQVSIGDDETPAVMVSNPGPISGNGRYALFMTDDSNMIPGDDEDGGPSTTDLFVRDLSAGTTTRMNVDEKGERLVGNYFLPWGEDISSDGRFVLMRFDEGNFGESLWLHDRDTDEDGTFDESGFISTRRVDRRADGTVLFDSEGLVSRNVNGSISDDARLTLFDTQVVGRSVSQVSQVHDRDADVDEMFDEPGAMELIEIDAGFLPAGDYTILSVLSRDGEHALWTHFTANFDFGGQAYVTDVLPKPFEVFTPAAASGSTWFLSNNFDETANYRPIAYGNSRDLKVAGDWNGNGTTDIGVVRDNLWLLSRDHDVKAEIQCRFGLASDKKVVGDWDGDGDWTPGVVRGNVWFLSDDCDGDAEHVLAYGSSTDKPLTGDWDGNGSVTPGVVRGNVWYLLDGLTSAPADHVFAYGSSTDKKLAGDWNGDDTWTPGVVRGVDWFLINENAAGPADHVFNFGFGGPDTVLAGDWDGFPD